MTKKRISSNRPLSPHLTIYRPQISSVLSILHRISGVVNYLGMVVILWWLTTIAFLPQDPTQTWIWELANCGIGKFIIFCWSFSVFFHLCTGIRHLFWDMGYGFDVKVMEKTGWLAVIMAITLTSIAWIMLYAIKG